MTPTEHNWLYNLGQTVHGLATGADGVDVVNAESGEHYTLSLRPFWDRVGSTELGAEAIALIAAAAGKGAGEGAAAAVSGLTLDVKLAATGTAEAAGS